MDLSTVSLLLTILTGTVLPGLSSLIYQQHWNPVLQGGITVVLSALVGLIGEFFTDPDHYSLTNAGLKASLAYIVAAVARSQFWRPKDPEDPNSLDAKLLRFPRKRVPTEGVPPHEQAA